MGCCLKRCVAAFWMIFVLCSLARSASGPLRRHPGNPRYFADARGKLVYLTGSHTWSNLVDMGKAEPPAPFDFDAYLAWMASHHHNFMRLWTWEPTTWDTTSLKRPGVQHAGPHPWARTGPGKARDGKPKFDLDKWNPVYFERLKTRVAAAGKRGIYTAVMMFEGWAMQFSKGAWETHPFHPDNNINGINGDRNGDGKGLEIHTLASPAITALQKRYMEKVINTVNGFDNVLYEISNENHPPSTQWQYAMIRHIQAYQKTKPKQHPVGMTFQYRGGSNKTLLDSPADWISPNHQGGWRDNPPAATGKKVIITDTDHLWGIGGNATWVWKSFLRGHNPIFMDPYDGVVLGKRFDPKWEPIRKAMGWTRQWAERIDLARMTPRPDLSSSKYCLADPGRAYLVYEPSKTGGDLLTLNKRAYFTVTLKRGNYVSEWYDPLRGRGMPGGQVALKKDGMACMFFSPFKGPALLHLKARPRIKPKDPVKTVQQVFRLTGLKDGLFVHLGCGRGFLMMQLCQYGRFLAHGLSRYADLVEQARTNLQKRGFYGRASVDYFDGKKLPYGDNMVNLLVAETLDKVPHAELMRVLAPGGILLVWGEGGWKKTIKPRPDDIDEWTHYLHGSGGNAVAHDKRVDTPRFVQWINNPRHTRSHEHTPSLNAMVSSAGRIFYIEDQAPIDSLLKRPKWHLVARDAHNGLELWHKSFIAWFPHILNWGSFPQHIQRRLVAVNDRLYVTLGLHAPVSCLDAATGEVLRAFEGTHGTEEIILHRGILLLVVREVTKARTSELAQWDGLSRKENSPLYKREKAEPLLKRFKATESKAPRSLMAFDAATGRLLWKKSGADSKSIKPLSLCAEGDRVFCQLGGKLVCFGLPDGKARWDKSTWGLRLVEKGRLLCVNNKSVSLLSSADGKMIWSKPIALSQVRDAFIINDSVWLGGFKPWNKNGRGPSWGPYFANQRDIETGALRMQIEPEDLNGPSHHHRCWTNKATDRFILSGRRGVEYLDLQSGEVLWHSWVRGVCRYGVMPANGLLYAPPHACACYIAAKLEGFYALSHDSTSGWPEAGKPLVIQRGPAYDASASHVKERSAPGWPTYRNDPQRSGYTKASVSSRLEKTWQTAVGGRLSAPVAGYGKVLAASVDGHQVVALDEASGEPLWRFTGGARVDSPPTLYQDHVLFGCRDGFVYCLRASDGQLAWRLQAAPHKRLIVVDGQLESASPVHGSILIQDGAACFTVGRSSYLDGGLRLLRVAPLTGRVLSETPIVSPDEEGRQPDQYGPCYMPGALSDILSCDDQRLYLRDAVMDKQGRPLPVTQFDKRRQPRPPGKPHLFTLTGFLDDSWAHRSYWIYGTRCSISTGCSGRDRDMIAGRHIVVTADRVFGYGRKSVHWSNQLEDGEYHLFAKNRTDRSVLWSKKLPVIPNAMLMAGDVLFAAGRPAEKYHRYWDMEKAWTHQLLAISAADGNVLSSHPLPAAPVFDGMAASNGRLYVSLKNGELLCMAASKE